MIRYRMDRAALGKDPYTNYTFQEILDEGGICMDQAYFAVNTAKCNGIPSRLCYRGRQPRAACLGQSADDG